MATTIPGDVAPRNWASWLTNNIGNATWWRSKALGQGVTDEGGVDVPLTGGTPIYALATGPLRGAGYFYHGGPFFSSQEYGASSNAPGYGVVSQQVNVPGLGLEDLYYQHIDIAPGINFCQSGNCGNQIVQAGQLIGYSKNPPGEAEVGLGANKSWGGIWGAVQDPGQWVNDPRQYLTNLAQQGGGPVNSADCASICGRSPTSPACKQCAQQDPNFAQQNLVPWGDALAAILADLQSGDWWTRVGLGVGAAIIIILGLLFFVKSAA